MSISDSDLNRYPSINEEEFEYKTTTKQMSVMLSSYLLTYKIRKIHSMEGHKKDFFQLNDSNFETSNQP